MTEKKTTKKRPDSTSRATDSGSKASVKGKSSIRYFEGVGRRKTAVARVRVTPGKGNMIFIANGTSGKEKSLKEYFPLAYLQSVATASFDKLDLAGKFDTTVKVAGGGANAQAEAVRLGVARALLKIDQDLRPKLRAFGFLTRDPRMVERKKYGLKKARRAPQWSKR